VLFILQKVDLCWAAVWFYNACCRWILIVVVIVLMQPIDDRFAAKQTFDWAVEFIIRFHKYDEYVTTVKCSS
jgi:hypothetical protein